MSFQTKYLKYKQKYLQLKKNLKGGECDPVPDLKDIENISMEEYDSRSPDHRITLNNKCYFVEELYKSMLYN